MNKRIITRSIANKALTFIDSHGYSCHAIEEAMALKDSKCYLNRAALKEWKNIWCVDMETGHHAWLSTNFHRYGKDTIKERQKLLTSMRKKMLRAYISSKPDRIEKVRKQLEEYDLFTY